MFSLQEEAPMSPSDSELPDMVPVSIRTTLPELQHYCMEKVLAGLLLTWDEFLQLFDIRLNSNEYFIRGANGSRNDLTRKIGEYVNSLKRKMKTYPVTLERVNGTNEVVNSNSSIPSFLNNNDSSDTQSPGINHNESQNIYSPSTSKKLKLLDGDKRSKKYRKAKESLEKIPQSVVQSPALKFPHPAKKVETQRSSDAISPIPTKDIDRIDDKSNDRASTPSDSTEQTTNNKVLPHGHKRKRLSVDRRQSKEIASPSNSLLVKMSKKSRPKARPVTRRSTNDTDSSDESTDSDEDEGPPTKAKKKVLKQMVLQYLSDKVSARSMLRLRRELMDLREQEKYFKVTSVVPMTAGMMEQTFCRKLHE